MENRWMDKEKNYIFKSGPLKATQELTWNQTFFGTSLPFFNSENKALIYFPNRLHVSYIAIKLG